MSFGGRTFLEKSIRKPYFALPSCVIRWCGEGSGKVNRLAKVTGCELFYASWPFVVALSFSIVL